MFYNQEFTPVLQFSTNLATPPLASPNDTLDGTLQMNALSAKQFIAILAISCTGTFAAYAQPPILTLAQESGVSPINRNSPSYIDFSARLSEKLPNNSIPLLLLRDSLRSGQLRPTDAIDILDDHKNRVSGVESFNSGRHTFSFTLGLGGKLRTPHLVQKFTGSGANIGGDLDVSFNNQTGTLIPTTDRIKRQTGLDYIIDHTGITTTACGTITGEIAFPRVGVPSGSTAANTRFCYEYQPNKMTALAQYEAANQQRLHQLERGIGEDFQSITDQLYLHYSSDCDVYVLADPKECGPIKHHVSALHEAGLGLDLPSGVKSEETLEQEFLKQSGNRFLFRELETTQHQLEQMELLFGRRLTDLEAAIIGVVGQSEDISGHLTTLQVEQIKQGKLLEYLADPKVREKLLLRAMQSAQQAVRTTKRRYEAANC